MDQASSVVCTRLMNTAASPATPDYKFDGIPTRGPVTLSVCHAMSYSLLLPLPDSYSDQHKQPALMILTIFCLNRKQKILGNNRR